MTEPTQHTYTREMMVDRLTEIRDILKDERTKIGTLSEDKQLDAAMHVYKAIQALQ